MPVSSATSLQSFQKLSSKIKVDSYARILMALQEGPASRSKLASVTSMRLSSICGRCKELLLISKIEVVGTVYDNTTRKTVELLGLVKVEAKRD